MPSKRVNFDPQLNPALHRRDCGSWGPCDCDAHALSFWRKIVRLWRAS